jgi:hypothetical protein
MHPNYRYGAYHMPIFGTSVCSYLSVEIGERMVEESCRQAAKSAQN